MWDVVFFLVLLGSVQTGSQMNRPMREAVRPPMVPAAKGNQNPSFTWPTMKGMKPRMVLMTVRKMGIILMFQALV